MGVTLRKRRAFAPTQPHPGDALRAAPTLPLQGRVYFGGLSSFHGSFTLGIVSISMLASLPAFMSVRRM